MSLKLPISLAIICLNEAENIERCIRSVPFASDIVVVDSGSTDDTADIAKRSGATVHQYEWRGFRAQKQLATDLCKHDWVLSLDADEALSPEAQAEIVTLFRDEPPSDRDGCEFPRTTFHLGRWIRHGGWYPDWQKRLFNRRKVKWGGGEHVHEHVENGEFVRMKAPILHYAFGNLREQINTNNRYSSLGAEEARLRGKRFSVGKLIFKPISKFLETYLIKKGFMDGLPGFIIAVGAAYSVFLKFAKLWELESGVSEK